ncbi:MAG: hypothetical protein MRY32_03060, partial [Rickettsiales bacterium]|nr:hypothetical protein [Rickettsiales bacterium]
IWGQLRGENSVILGRLQDGRRCTLLNYRAYVMTHKWPDGEHYKTDITAHYLFLGEAFHSPDDITFDHILLELTHFNHWMNQPLSINYPSNDFSETVITREELGFDVNIARSGMKIGMHPSFEYPILPSYTEGVKVNYQYAMNISLEQPITNKELKDLHFSITSLFTLLCAEPVYHQTLLAYRNNTPVQVYATSYNRYDPSFDKSEIDITELPITHDSLSDNQLNTLFLNWFSIHEEYKDFIVLLVSSFIQKHTLESRFLILAKCLEIFYNLQYPNKQFRIDEQECESFIDQINFPESMDKTFIKQVKKQILWVNSFTNFEAKLLSLFDEIPPQDIAPIIDNPRSIDAGMKEFAKKVANTRNYYTHYGSTPEKERFSLDELFKTSNKLKMIALKLLYKKLGVEDVKDRVLCLLHK